MTDRVKGLTVALIADIRGDDADLNDAVVALLQANELLTHRHPVEALVEWFLTQYTIRDGKAYRGTVPPFGTTFKYEGPACCAPYFDEERRTLRLCHMKPGHWPPHRTGYGKGHIEWHACVHCGKDPRGEDG